MRLRPIPGRDPYLVLHVAEFSTLVRIVASVQWSQTDRIHCHLIHEWLVILNDRCILLFLLQIQVCNLLRFRRFVSRLHRSIFLLAMEVQRSRTDGDESPLVRHANRFARLLE